MKTTIITGLLFALFASTASGEEERYTPLLFLVGHCWQGTFPDGKTTDTHCYEDMLGGQFIRDLHVVRGEGPDYKGETLYYVDGETGQTKFVYFNSIGGTSFGEMHMGENGDMIFPEDYTGEDGTRIEIRSLLRRREDGGYFVISEMKKDGAWEEAWRITFERASISSLDELK